SLLAHLARRIGNERVLILGTYRPADVDLSRHPIREARLELERYGVAEELALAPLDSGALHQIVAEELGAPPSRELLAWLERHAGSNPLFFGELMRWLVDQGFAKESYGAWTLDTPPDTLEVPRTAESAIERRLDRLDPEVIRILEYASVEGNEFGSTTLAELLGMDELELEEAIEPLVRLHRLVRMVDTRELPSGDLSTIYQFGHSLVQDVLHRSLKGKRRILLHRRMAEILERIYAGRDTIAHRLALHFDEGRQPARAFEFGLLGAARASSVFAHLEAIELIRRALRNAETDAQRATAYERLGDSLRLAGRHAEARDALRRALEHAGALDDPEMMIRLRRMMIVVERSHGSRQRADLENDLVALADECRKAGARAELCEVVWLLNGLYDSGSSPTAVARARDALAVCDELDDRELLAKANYNYGRTLASGGEPASALPHLRRALELFEAMENRYAAGNCRNLLGILLILGGDYQGGAAEFDAAARVFDALGDPGSEAHVRSNLGALLTRLGRWDEAVENLREAIRLDLRMDATAWLLSPLENLARLHQARDDWTAAREQWHALLGQAQSTGYADVQALAYAALGLCSLEQGDAAAARAHEQAARALLQSQADWSDGRTEHSILAARLAAADGQNEAAAAMLRVAEDALQPRDPWLWANVRLLRGEIRSASSPAEAAELVREALATFENLGAEPLIQRATATLLILGEP
ncbi:MAG TPA: tetratricopeptide repeat protein, partial [Thermoanaerobaculia bacterium]|nr:tetratricopeptide repeat protein [Thermoanaerobaculia bacterium]